MRRVLGTVTLAALAGGATSIVRYRAWFARETRGVEHFGKTLDERRAFPDEIRRRGRFPVPVIVRAARAAGGTIPNGVNFHGTTAPPQCSRADFQRAVGYVPRADDVFVVTQMKCGTTWMKQIVYETLLHGRGDLSDAGGRHIYNVSSWIESSWAHPMGAAPTLGEPGRRLIKSHLPATLLPVTDTARYVYVTRDPAACYASCVAFLEMLIGPVMPPHAKLLDWFCSDRMWWGAWPDHVQSWWRAAQNHPSVLFVHFEEMHDDLGAVVDRVAAHLDVALTAAERAEVVRKSGHAYMREHEERFTMAPPTAFQTGRDFVREGSAHRGNDLDAADRERVNAFCRERLRGGDYPVTRFYPHLA